MKRPTKTVKVAVWTSTNGTRFETTIEKRGKWFVWYSESSGERRSDHIDGPRYHAESRGGRIEVRPNPRYEEEMRAYRLNQSLRMITGILR